MQKRKIITALLVLILTVMLAGCGSVTVPKPERTEGAEPVRVTGSCEITANGDVITVSGETDLPDGALLHISILSQDGMTVDSAIITKNGDQISHDFALPEEERAELIERVQKATDGQVLKPKIQGFISCAPSQYGQQPEGIYDLLGNKFENVEADKEDFIWNTGGIVLVFASEMIELP